MSKLTWSVGLAVTGVLAACSSTPSDPSPPVATASRSSAPTSAPSTGDTPASAKVTERCGPPAAPARPLVLHGPGGARLSAAEVGRGPVGAVFLHETGSSGFCGFWAYAVWLQREYGIHSLLLDMCNYGESVCSTDHFSQDYVAQAAIAVRWLRAHGGRRMTIVGASLGGAVAAVASAEIRPRVDGVVDLSGPLTWTGLDVGRAAPQIQSDALFAVARQDPVVSVGDLRSAWRSIAAAGKDFVVAAASAGHGWQLLSRTGGAAYEPTGLARQVAGWIRGGARTG